MAKYKILVHGGAGEISAERLRYTSAEYIKKGVSLALEAGSSVLEGGGSALDGVLAAVCELEDFPAFNAGKGAVLTKNSNFVLSASIMDGSDLRVGAVAGLKTIKNPVTAAQSLLDHRHSFLYGEGPEELELYKSSERVAEDYFLTEWRKKDLENLILSEKKDLTGTVGAVALDQFGNLAAATSTGGVVGQFDSRVSDTPQTGSGNWADQYCAVSGTGTGDEFIRVAFARRVADLMELANKSIEEAGAIALKQLEFAGGNGGAIVVKSDGQHAFPYNSKSLIAGVAEKESGITPIIFGL